MQIYLHVQSPLAAILLAVFGLNVSFMERLAWNSLYTHYIHITKYEKILLLELTIY